MESLGSFPCTESDSFMVPQFLDLSLFSSGHDKRIPISLSSAGCVDKTLFRSLDNPVNNGYSCNPSDYVSIPTYFMDGYNQISEYNDAFMSMENCMGIADANDPYGTMCPDIAMEGPHFVNGNMNNALVLAKEMLMKRKFDSAELQRSNFNIADPSEYARKRLRVSRDGGSDGQSSCSYSSDDENVASVSKAYQAANSNEKARATRGGATDPQSIYARKRRERINGRLKILQNLVPNGTKVDISTMLEEAVHYVKFLQLQIKLLSSDELWMYAPLAYNGVDMGLYQKIFSKLLQK